MQGDELNYIQPQGFVFFSPSILVINMILNFLSVKYNLKEMLVLLES